MANKAPYSNNLHGACTVYAVANLFHFMEGSDALIQNFKERPQGHLIADVQFMLNYVANGVHNGILCFGVPINKTDFFNLYPFWELSESVFENAPEIHAFVPLLLYTEKNNVRHVVAAYLSLENMLLTVIDSVGDGSVVHVEVNQYFTEKKVVGVCMMLVETNTGFIPYLLQDETIKSVIYGKTEKIQQP